MIGLCDRPRTNSKLEAGLDINSPMHVIAYVWPRNSSTEADLGYRPMYSVYNDDPSKFLYDICYK